MVDYLIEKLKREQRSKTIQQAGYLLIKGLVAKKGGGGRMFDVLDDLFELPKKEKKPQKTQDELIDEFENYIKGV